MDQLQAGPFSDPGWCPVFFYLRLLGGTAPLNSRMRPLVAEGLLLYGCALWSPGRLTPELSLLCSIRAARSPVLGPQSRGRMASSTLKALY